MKISILTANYNNSNYLPDFFESILKSSFHDFEVIFVDDGSSDNSVDIVYLYKQKIKNLNLIKLENNVGFANALNIGLTHCRGEYVARIDPDDIMSCERLSLQSRYLDENPLCGVIGSQARYFSSASGELLNTTNKPIGCDSIWRHYFNKDNGVLHGTVMIRASIYKKYKYFQEDVPSEDYAIFAKMTRDRVVFENIDKCLTMVRVHAASVSNNIKFSTIEKVFSLRKCILGVNYYAASVYREYLVLYFYRLAMYQKSKFFRWIFLVFAGIFGIERVVKRLKVSSIKLRNGCKS